MQSKDRASSVRRGLAVLALLAACTLVVLYYWNSLWAASIDLGLHYAVTARIMEYGHAPTTVDPSLGIMNGYPSLAHTVAAILGEVLGSALAGLQLTSLISVVVLWSSLAVMLLALPWRRGWIAFIAVICLFLLNGSAVHLELFGNELLWNFFFPQLVGQAAAFLVIAAVLIMERIQVAPTIRCLTLGAAVPVLAQLHPLPALEVWGVLALQVAADFAVSKSGNRRAALVIGLGAAALSLAVTVLNPTFITVSRISQNNGVLNLRYTPTPADLGIECAVVIACSTALFVRWARLGAGDGQRSNLALKYFGLLGLTISGLCLLQVVMLAFGVGSLYAVKKYAYGLNTLLVLELPLLLASWPGILPAAFEAKPANWVTSSLSQAIPAVLVLASVFSIMPPTSTRIAALAEVLPIERFAMMYRNVTPGSDSGKFDYAAGLGTGDGAVEFMITIGVLKTPQGRNVDGILWGGLPPRPRLVGRVFTRVGSERWDIPACRQLVTPDGFAILDGTCVMQHLLGTGS